MVCRFRYKVSRLPPSKESSGIVEEEKTYEMKMEPTDQIIRQNLAKMLEGNRDTASNAIIPELLPKFLKVKNNGELKPIHQLLKGPNSK